MMNLIVMGLSLIGAGVIEMVCPVSALLGQAKPPLVMCLVLYYALNRSLALMLGAALLGGVMSDSLTALPLGVSSLGLLAVGLVARLYREVVFSGRWITHMVFGALAGISMTLVVYGVLWLTEEWTRELSGIRVILNVLGVGVYGLVLIPVVYRLMEGLERRVGNLEMGTVE